MPRYVLTIVNVHHVNLVPTSNMGFKVLYSLVSLKGHGLHHITKLFGSKRAREVLPEELPSVITREKCKWSTLLVQLGKEKHLLIAFSFLSSINFNPNQYLDCIRKEEDIVEVFVILDQDALDYFWIDSCDDWPHSLIFPICLSPKSLELALLYLVHEMIVVVERPGQESWHARPVHGDAQGLQKLATTGQMY